MPDREGKRVPDHRSDILTGSLPQGPPAEIWSSSGVQKLFKKYIRGSSPGGSGGGSGATRLSTYACARASSVT